LRAPIARITPLGNRARVSVGPLVAEVTTASIERLALREGEPVVASFKATAARLLPLA
jgi:TOBE domain